MPHAQSKDGSRAEGARARAPRRPTEQAFWAASQEEIRSGQLMDIEAADLKRKEDRINDIERTIKSVGKLSAAERAKIKKELDNFAEQTRSTTNRKTARSRLFLRKF